MIFLSLGVCFVASNTFALKSVTTQCKGKIRTALEEDSQGTFHFFHNTSLVLGVPLHNLLTRF